MSSNNDLKGLNTPSVVVTIAVRVEGELDLVGVSLDVVRAIRAAVCSQKRF